jgi:hypothetical protein
MASITDTVYGYGSIDVAATQVKNNFNAVVTGDGKKPNIIAVNQNSDALTGFTTVLISWTITYVPVSQ